MDIIVKKLTSELETLSDTEDAVSSDGGNDNPHTGVVLAIVPALAAAVGFAISKKRKVIVSPLINSQWYSSIGCFFIWKGEMFTVKSHRKSTGE